MKTHATGAAGRATALVLTAGLLLSSCSGGVEDAGEDASPTTSPSPTSTVPVPSGVSLTEPGTELGFGESGTVIFEANQNRGSVLRLTVKKAVRGSVKDFSSFILDEYTRSATPYYVSVSVTNVGQGDVGGVPVPLWGVDGDNTLLPAATFTTNFAKCQSEPLPTKFPADASLDTCLVFLAPEKGTLTGVSFRPTQQFNPIVWTGEVTTPAPDPAPEPKKKQKPGKKKR
jgi:hypothetical protein